MDKLFDLTGRVSIVTGGNGGIGLGMARGLAQAGATIVVVGRNAEKNAKTFEVKGDFNPKEVFAALQAAGLTGKAGN